MGTRLLACADSANSCRHVAIFSCGHRLCFTCSSHFVGDKVSGAQVSRKQLICPIPDCKTALTGQEVRGCLADQPQLLAKYSSFTLQVCALDVNVFAATGVLACCAAVRPIREGALQQRRCPQQRSPPASAASAADQLNASVSVGT